MLTASLVCSNCSHKCRGSLAADPGLAAAVMHSALSISFLPASSLLLHCLCTACTINVCGHSCKRVQARKRSVAVSSMVESGKLRPPSSRGTREGASSVAGTTAAGPNSGANSGTAPADAADKDLEQTVIAECFKIMPQAAAAGPERTIGSAGPAGGSITMIKYTNLKEQAQRAGEIEEELPPLEEDEPLLPTNTTIIPTVGCGLLSFVKPNHATRPASPG